MNPRGTALAKWIEEHLGFATFASLVLGLLLGLAIFTPACQRPRSAEDEYMTLEQMRVARKYTEELDECVRSSATLAQSRICRCDVNQRWGRACVDEITVVP